MLNRSRYLLGEWCIEIFSSCNSPDLGAQHACRRVDDRYEAGYRLPRLGDYDFFPTSGIVEQT